MSEELDYQELVSKFDETWEPEEETLELEGETGEEEQEEVEETAEETETEAEENPAEEETNQPDFKNDKQNQAFAELRRKAEENEKARSFLKQLADEAGVTEEEVLQRYEQRALEVEAQKNNVPVEVMKRLRTLEEENEQVKSTATAERMNFQIQQTIDKYGATDDDIRATFEEMIRAGVDPRTNPNADFEKFYRAANFEKIMEQKVNEAKQTSLSQKKKRQEQAAIPNGTSTSQPGTSDIDEIVSKDAASILENW